MWVSCSSSNIQCCWNTDHCNFGGIGLSLKTYIAWSKFFQSGKYWKQYVSWSLNCRLLFVLNYREVLNLMCSAASASLLVSQNKQTAGSSFIWIAVVTAFDKERYEQSLFSSKGCCASFSMTHFRCAAPLKCAYKGFYFCHLQKVLSLKTIIHYTNYYKQ